MEEFVDHIFSAINGSVVSEQALSNTSAEIDSEGAYATQEQLVLKQVSSGNTQVGWKIALTNVAGQNRFAIDEPVFGALFTAMHKKSGSAVPHPDPLAAHVEGELAFMFAQDCPPDCAEAAQLLGYLSDVRLSFEVASRRIVGSLNVVDLIADNAAGYCFLLSDSGFYPKRFDFAGCSMRMSRNGECISSGAAVDVLGNPLDSVLWLIKKLGMQGKCIRAGDVVLSGSMCLIPNAAPEDSFGLVLCGRDGEVLDSIEMYFASSRQ